MQIVYIPLSKIDKPADPARINIPQAELQDLIDSILERGLLQPILLKRKDDRFEIEAGHRRFLSLKQLNWECAPSIILENTVDSDLHIERAHENLIREDLSVIEEAKLVNSMVNENGRGTEETARLIKRSVSWVEARLEILNYQDDLIAALSQNKINLAVAKELSRCKNMEYRYKLLDYIIEAGASSKTVAAWVNDSSLEDFTEALEQSRETGIIQQIDLGPTYMECGICIQKLPADRLRHVWLCPTCIDGIMMIRKDITKEQNNHGPENADREKYDHD